MKKNKTSPVLILFLLLLLVKVSRGQVALLQIDSCYAMTQRNYPLIKQYDLIEKANEYSISNANKAYLPQVSVTGIGAYVFGGFPSLGPPTSGQEEENMKFIGLGQLNQVIWDGGATKSKKNISDAQSAVEKSNVDVQMYALKERINQLFFGILLMDEQIKQIDIQIEMLNRNVKRLELLNKNGYALSTETKELSAEVLKIKQRRIEFVFTRKGYKDMLALFLGSPLDDSIKLLKPDMLLIGDTINKRPELLMYSNQRRLADEQYSIDRVKMMPKIGLLGAGVLITPGINLGGKDKSSIALAGLNLSWELGGLYTHSGNKNLYKNSLSKIRVQEETFLFNNNLQSSQSGTEIEKCRAILQSDDEILNLRTSIREGYQLQYENGKCSLFDLINATEKETEAKSNKALHDVQLMLAIYQLKSAKGN